MGASLAKVRAGKVRGCGGLEVELEGEGLIAIVKGYLEEWLEILNCR